MKKTVFAFAAVFALSGAAFAAENCECQKGDLACLSACARAKVQSATDKAAAKQQAAKAESEANNAEAKDNLENLKTSSK